MRKRKSRDKESKRVEFERLNHDVKTHLSGLVYDIRFWCSLRMGKASYVNTGLQLTGPQADGLNWLHLKSDWFDILMQVAAVSDLDASPLLYEYFERRHPEPDRGVAPNPDYLVMEETSKTGVRASETSRQLLHAVQTGQLAECEELNSVAQGVRLLLSALTAVPDCGWTAKHERLRMHMIDPRTLEGTVEARHSRGERTGRRSSRSHTSVAQTQPTARTPGGTATALEVSTANAALLSRQKKQAARKVMRALVQDPLQLVTLVENLVLRNLVAIIPPSHLVGLQTSGQLAESCVGVCLKPGKNIDVSALEDALHTRTRFSLLLQLNLRNELVYRNNAVQGKMLPQQGACQEHTSEPSFSYLVPNEGLPERISISDSTVTLAGATNQFGPLCEDVFNLDPDGELWTTQTPAQKHPYNARTHAASALVSSELSSHDGHGDFYNSCVDVAQASSRQQPAVRFHPKLNEGMLEAVHEFVVGLKDGGYWQVLDTWSVELENALRMYSDIENVELVEANWVFKAAGAPTKLALLRSYDQVLLRRCY